MSRVGRIIRRLLEPVKHAPRVLLLLRGHDDETAVEARLDVAEPSPSQRPDDPIRREAQLAIEALREAPPPVDVPIDEIVDLDGRGLELEETREHGSVVAANGDEPLQLLRLDREV